MEPFFGRHRRRPRPDSDSLLKHVAAVDVSNDQSVRCDGAGDFRCFEFNSELFPDITVDKNIRQMPEVGSVRVLPASEFMIIVMQTTGNGNVKYWLTLSSHDWLERDAASWPIDKTATGWSRSELRLFVRPNALRMWWMRMHKTISNAWVAAGGARLLQARQFPRAVSASASVAHRTNEKISWRPCKCLYVLCLVCHMFCDVWLVIFWLCLDGFKRKNLNLDFARYSCRTQKAGGPRPTGRYIDMCIYGKYKYYVR